MAVRTCAMRALSICVLALAMAAPAQAQTPQESFARAMAQRERGDLHEAIQSFHAILSEHPGLNRARLELAVAYYHFLDHTAALGLSPPGGNSPPTFTPPAVIPPIGGLPGGSGDKGNRPGWGYGDKNHSHHHQHQQRGHRGR